MTALSALIAGLLGGIGIAMVGAAIGFGVRSGGPPALDSGGWAMLSALAAVSLAERSGLGTLVNAAVCVPAAFGLAYLLAAVTAARAARWRGVGGQPEFLDGATGLMLAEIAVLAGAVALATAMWGEGARGGPGQDTMEPIEGLVIVNQQIAGAVVGLVALIGFGVFLARSKFGLRTRALGAGPALLARGGVDRRQIRSVVCGAGAALAALGGLVYGQGTAVSASDALMLTVLGAEAALIGGLTSLSSLAAAGVVLGLVRAGGDQLAAGWGPLAGHALALLAVAARALVGGRSLSGLAGVHRGSGLGELDGATDVGSALRHGPAPAASRVGSDGP